VFLVFHIPLILFNKFLLSVILSLVDRKISLLYDDIFSIFIITSRFDAVLFTLTSPTMSSVNVFRLGMSDREIIINLVAFREISNVLREALKSKTQSDGRSRGFPLQINPTQMYIFIK